MENEKLMQISSYAAVIHSKLEEIRYITSAKQLVSVFQELVVKLLQFSSNIHHAKKILKDELQRKNIKVLLKSIKDSIPELSGACQESLNANTFELFKRKEDVIRKLRYTVEVAENIIKDQKLPSYLSLQQSSRKTTDEDKVGLFHDLFGAGLGDDSNSCISTPLIFSASEAISEYVEVSQSQSVPSGNNHLRLGFQTLSLSSREIKRQISELFKDQEHFVSCDKYIKQDFGKKLLHNLDEFISLAKTSETLKDICDATKVCNELHELGLDFVSMILDYNSSNMREDDFTILLNVQKHLEKYLHDIIKIVQNEAGKEDLLTSNELEAKEIIEEIPKYAARRNFIGLVDSTVVFFDTCKSSKNMLKEMARANFQEEFQTFKRKFQTESREIEYALNELIERIEDEEAIQRLVAKMHKFVDSLNDCHSLFLSKRTDKPDCSAILKKEMQGGSAIGKNDSDVKTNASVLIDQFIKAINDIDYKTVEILANRLLSNIKLVGELLQGITHYSSKDGRDLCHLFAKYFKKAGGFCSKARTLVLSDMDRDMSVGSLLNTGIEMEDMRKKFLQKCRISLRPWFDLSYSTVRTKFKEQSKQKRTFLGVTKKLRQLVETLSDTEYVEQLDMKSKLTKLSNLITKTSELITRERDGYSSNGFLMDFYCLQWACAALNFLEIVDRVSINCLHHDPSSLSNDELLELPRAWISMLQTLSICCTDAEASKEVSKISSQLISIATRIESEEYYEEVDGVVEFSITRRELFANILVAMELTDILTQGVREPVRGYIDPLASLSFAPNLQSFLAIRDAFHDKMDVVHTMSCLAVRDSVFRTKAHHVFVAADELRDVSNELISTLQSSHDESKKKLYFLKLRWRLAATYLIKALLTVPEANYTAVAGVMRHLESASHDPRYNDLISVLNDFGSRKAFSRDAWKLKRELSPNGFFADEISADLNSSNYSILDYPDSGDTNVLPTSLPRIESSESTYFRNYSMNLQEESAPPLPLIQTPDTFNPQSSFSSTRSSSSHDTEIFIPKVAKKPSFGAPKDNRKSAHQDRNRPTESTHSPENVGRVSWEVSSKDEVDGPVIAKNESKISQSIAAAAQILLRELEEWEEDENSIITVVKKMTNQMLDMADYAMGTGDLKSKEDFINTAKAIAANAHIVAKFAVIIADHCLDEACQLNLLHYAEIVPTLSTQLNIIASVKAATPNDETADVMLIANAENLMRSVSGTLRAAESASVKMKCDSEGKDGAPRSKAAALAIKWKKKLDFRRSMESITAPTNELGLKIIRDDSSWSLTDLT